jgi:hypothetical protein
MAELPRKVEINIAAIPVAGFGGACMVIASLVCSVALPQTRWFMLLAVVVGLVLGAAMICLRRPHDRRTPADVDGPPAAEDPVPLRRSRDELITLGRLRAAEIGVS